MKTIFVNIASYQDYQILPTLHDALLQAKYPDRLHFCIIHQYDNKDFFLFEEFYKDPRVTLINIPYSESKGACYARHLGNQKYKGEDYVLMCDSHTRFIKNWDEEFIDMHNRCLKHSKKACISSYCTLFEVNSEFTLTGNRAMLPAFKDKTGVLRFKNVEKKDNELRQHAFWGACLSFSDGAFFQEVPYDPDLYFFGEEISIAIRGWTRGWDFYLPDKTILEHDVTNTPFEYRRIRHQNAHWDKAQLLNQKSLNKAKRICLGEVKGIFGIGKERTLEEYEAAAGVSFKDQYIWHGENRNYRPFPAFKNYQEFKKHIKPNNRFADVKVDWSNHKEKIEKLKDYTDYLRVRIYWEGRDIIIPITNGMEYSCVFKQFPIDVLSILEATTEEENELPCMVEVYFYKKDEQDNFIRNELFCINDNIHLSFKIDNKEYSFLSKHIWGEKWINYWGPKDYHPKKTVEKLKRKEELSKLNTRILFIHIPKCAGNSIKASLHTFWESRKISYIDLKSQHVSKKELLKFWNIKETKSFKILSVFRNPFDRLYSCYKFGFKQSKKYWYQESKAAFFNRPYSFEYFCKILYESYINNFEWHEVILQPQYSFIEDLDGNIKDVYLLDYANLQEEWDNLCIKFNMGKKRKLLNLNSSSKKSVDFMSMYTEETVKMVEKIYEKDINIYQQVVDRQFTINS